MQPDDAQIDRVCSRMRMIWAIMLFVPLIYLLVCLYLTQQSHGGVDPNRSIASLRTIFLLVGGIQLVTAFRLHRFLLARGGSRPARREQAIMSAFLAGWAILEAIAILGTVLVVLGGRLVDGAPFLLAAFLGIYRLRPDETELRMRLSDSNRGEGRWPTS